MSAIQEFATKAEDLVTDPSKYLLRVFLAGPSGGGKTEGALTMPGYKLLIDLDGRSATAIGKQNVDVIQILEPNHKSPTAWDKMKKLTDRMEEEISAEDFPYDSIIVDGITMMGRISLNWALLLDNHRGLGGSPARQHYGPQMNDLSKCILKILALPRHVCFTGHMLLQEKDGMPESTMKLAPKITGQLKSELSNWFDETYYVYRLSDEDTGKRSYRWLTGGSEEYEFFKSTLNNLGDYWEDPITLDKNNPIRGFEDLMTRRFGDAWTKHSATLGRTEDREAETKEDEAKPKSADKSDKS